MKYTTVIAAGLAAGVSADGWESWSSSTSSSSTVVSASTKPTYSTGACPDKVTQTITQTAACAEVTSEIYSSTITVDAPKTKTITVDEKGNTAANGAWEEWSSSSEYVHSTSVPAGCVPQVVTETATEWATKKGSTTTVYKSTLYVGAGEAAKETVTITKSGGAAATGGAGWGVSVGSGGVGVSVGGEEVSVGTEGVGIGVGTEVYKWTVPVPTGTKSYPAPEYTQKPDGDWGYDWGSWDGPGSSGGDGGSGHSGSGAGNMTAGSPGSNVTKPFEPIDKNQKCNQAGNRGAWCNGKNIDTDYYQEYFSGNTCTADFTLTNTTINFDGTPRLALAVNGQVPGPTLECNWGDIIKVTVHNKMDVNGTSIHWHGIRQLGTNDMDGVPGVTECPIAPGQSKTYTFHASSYGTSWYHSHWLAQYGDGVYGPIVIHGPATADYDVDMGVVAVQDTFNVTAAQQNYLIAHFGPKNTHNYLLNGHNVQPDLSAGQHSLWEVEAGKKYLFRLLNSAAQNMFSMSLDNHEMEVIAADFVPIVPYKTNWINIGIGQRYDVVIEMNQKVDSYFFRAVTQLQCPSACDNTGLGAANGIVSYKGAGYALPTSTTTKTLADFNICDDEPLASLVPHVVKPAGSATKFKAIASQISATQPTTVATQDDGVVFQWFLNKKSINVNYTQPTLESLAQGQSPNGSAISNPIVLYSKNQWAYFVIQNQFFAAHPMHLHGHDFSLLGQGFGLFDITTMSDKLNFDSPMRRDTAMLKGAGPGPAGPTGYTVIGFETDNPGAWLMHCHIVWHVDGGLALQWIERPDDITYNKYVDGDFNQQCSAYEAYEAKNPAFKKTSGEAGLKKRLFFDEQVEKIQSYQFDDVVRRTDSSEKRYIDNMHVKRSSFGDGYHPRHFGRK